MTRLKFDHDELTFDGTPIDNLSYTQKGELKEYLDDIPSVEELDVYNEYPDIIENVSDWIKDLKEDVLPDFNDDVQDTLKEELDRLTDILNGF